MVAVAGSNDIEDGVGTLADDPILLLASAFSVEPESLQDMLVGRMQRLMNEFKDLAKNLSCDSVGAVMRALLSHTGWHSNRVWAGIRRMAELSGYGISTVKRVMAFFRATLIIQRLQGDERLTGPGPHEYPVEKRKNDKRMESACYDLSGFIPHLNGVLRETIESLLRGDLEPLRPVRAAPPAQDVDEIYTDPFADTANVTDQKTVPVRQSSGFDLEDAFSSIPVKTEHHFDSKTGSDTLDHEDLGYQIESTIPPEAPFPCNVDDLYKSNEKRTNEEKPKAKSCFSSPEMDPTIIEYSHEEIAGYKQAHEALEAVGADFPLRKKVIKEWGVPDALDFALYGVWRRIFGDANGMKIANMGGYLTGTFKEMRNLERKTKRNYRIWIEDFLIWKRQQSPVTSLADLQAPPPTPKQEKPAPQKVEKPQLPEFDLAKLSDAERDDLFSSALARVYTYKHVEKNDKLRGWLFEEGWKSQWILSAARNIWLEKAEKRAITDAAKREQDE